MTRRCSTPIDLGDEVLPCGACKACRARAAAAAVDDDPRVAGAQRRVLQLCREYARQAQPERLQELAAAAVQMSLAEERAQRREGRR